MSLKTVAPEDVAAAADVADLACVFGHVARAVGVYVGGGRVGEVGVADGALLVVGGVVWEGVGLEREGVAGEEV